MLLLTVCLLELTCMSWTNWIRPILNLVHTHTCSAISSTTGKYEHYYANQLLVLPVSNSATQFFLCRYILSAHAFFSSRPSFSATDLSLSVLSLGIILFLQYCYEWHDQLPLWLSLSHDLGIMSTPAWISLKAEAILEAANASLSFKACFEPSHHVYYPAEQTKTITIGTYLLMGLKW